MYARQQEEVGGAPAIRSSTLSTMEDGDGAWGKGGGVHFALSPPPEGSSRRREADIQNIFEPPPCLLRSTAGPSRRREADLAIICLRPVFSDPLMNPLLGEERRTFAIFLNLRPVFSGPLMDPLGEERRNFRLSSGPPGPSNR